ncbi:MAG TPA: class I SAM-dependent methyltransferase [Candidatus Altiarchaeales archaeon]|nr:class I SAM-dependent methyltransferase [Candidatus Altiarchaeales archaeon]
MKGDWFKRFSDGGKLYLNDESFQPALSAIKEDLPTYLEYIREGDKVLEAACGPGYTAIPLSHYFKVTGFDRDVKVLDAARQNGEKYGKDVEFVEADFFDIVKAFGKNSFDAVSSGGVLEHFPKDKIKTLLDLQLEVAPIVFAQMPLFTKEQVEGVNQFGIETHHYTKKDYLEDIFKGYNILEHRTLEKRPVFGRFREFMAVIGR